jgi:apoptosis-inducing factor 2
MLPEEDKATSPHTFIQAQIKEIRPHSIIISRSLSPSASASTSTSSHPFTDTSATIDEEIPFDYAIYALGSRLPAPMDPWGHTPEEATMALLHMHEKEKVLTPRLYGGMKNEGVEWLKRYHEVVEKNESVLVVGGGALGVRMCSFPSRY